MYQVFLSTTHKYAMINSPQCKFIPNKFRFSLKLQCPFFLRLSNLLLKQILIERNKFEPNIWNKNIYKNDDCRGRLRNTFKVVFLLVEKTQEVAIKNSPPRSTTMYLSPTLSCPNTDEFCSLSFVRCWQ